MDEVINALDHNLADFSSVYGRVLNFIHYEVDSSKLKAELVTYSETIGKADIALLIPANRVGVEGSIAYCINRGANLLPSSTEKVAKILDAYVESAKDVLPDWEHLPDTLHGKQIRAYVACYSRIDNAKTRVLRGKLEQRALAAEIRKIVTAYAGGKIAVVKMLKEHYQPSLSEAIKDELIKDWVKPLATISDTISLMVNNRASIKAGAKGAKARKMASTASEVDRKGEKAATKVTYKDEDDALGIRSVDPVNLVGSEAAVIYNTKTRHIEFYRAKQGMKLSFQGARIVNFDEASSIGKTIRKPETDLPHWTRATTVRRLEVLSDGIRGKKWEPSGKMNRNTIIIKIM